MKNENNYLKPRISSQEYYDLPDNEKHLYMCFCGHKEVYYTLNPMAPPESKEVESVPVKSAEEILNEISNIDDKELQEVELDCISVNYTTAIDAMEIYASQFKTNPIIESDKSAEEIFSKHRTEYGSTDTNEIYAAMEDYATSKQNRIDELEYKLTKLQVTNPIEVIKKRVEELERNKSSYTYVEYETKIYELNHIIKLLQQ